MAGAGKKTEVVDDSGACVLEKRMPIETFEPPPLSRAVSTYFSYLVLYVVSLVGDFLCSIGLKTTGHVEAIKRDVRHSFKSSERQLFNLLFQDWFKMNRGFETFFARNMYRRVRDCWNRPIASTPGAYTDLVDRVSDDFNWTFR